MKILCIYLQRVFHGIRFKVKEVRLPGGGLLLEKRGASLSS